MLINTFNSLTYEFVIINVAKPIFSQHEKHEKNFLLHALVT